MRIFLSRFLLLVVATTIPLFAFGANLSKNSKPSSETSVQLKLAALESSFGGKIGIYAINTANGMTVQHRANERFPMGCTSKVIGVGAILKQSMSNSNLLEKRIMYSKNDVMDWSPTAKNHVADGMTVAQLCEAAIVQSDNTAMNLLIKQLGGLKAMNDFAHLTGNHTFRQDRNWPGEALATPYDLRDSSNPKDMANSLQQLVLGNILASSQRELLTSWLKNSVTGYSRIRAGIPKGWVVGDKTGSGFYYGIDNDIAVIWPPQAAKPIIIAVYTMGNKKESPKRNDIIASSASIIIAEFIRTDRNLQIKPS